MAADLYIHVIPNESVIGTVRTWRNGKREEYQVEGEVDQHVLKTFFSNTIGSRWYSGRIVDQEQWDRAYALIARTPSVWVGEVSWLKAGLFNDEQTFIPETVKIVSEVIDEDLPIISDELIEKIKQGFQCKNNTSYDIASENDVISFLEKYKGFRCFTVNW